jgi:hypothetical protein
LIGRFEAGNLIVTIAKSGIKINTHPILIFWLLTLPLYPKLTDDVTHIIDVIRCYHA